jgi:hypothetical protein
MSADTRPASEAIKFSTASPLSDESTARQADGNGSAHRIASVGLSDNPVLPTLASQGVDKKLAHHGRDAGSPGAAISLA